jgi:RloB-like protein
VIVPRDGHPRARRAAKLARKQGKRPAYVRILIVCEGSKTEPLYLDDIRQQLRIPTAHIKVIPSTNGTQPRQVVDCAEQTFLSSKNFDLVIAVFDRDDHSTYHDALSRAKALDLTLRNDDRKLVEFKAVPSVPCFELWILLHFQDVHAFWHREDIIAAVSKTGRIPSYHKGSTDIFVQTKGRLRDATARAEYLRTQFNPAIGTDPYTDMDWLVEKLRSLSAT